MFLTEKLRFDVPDYVGVVYFLIAILALFLEKKLNLGIPWTD